MPLFHLYLILQRWITQCSIGNNGKYLFSKRESNTKLKIFFFQFNSKIPSAKDSVQVRFLFQRYCGSYSLAFYDRFQFNLLFNSIYKAECAKKMYEIALIAITINNWI